MPIHGLPGNTLNLSLLKTTIIFCKMNKLYDQSITVPIRLFISNINNYVIGNPMAIYGAIQFLMVGDNQQITELLWNKNGVNFMF